MPSREQSLATAAVRGAVLGGLLEPVETLRCADCAEAAQAYHHHRGYAPQHRLDVIPLCDRCHARRHRPQRDFRRRPDRPLHRLNLEVYPDEEPLYRLAKAEAFRRGQKLREWLFDAVRCHLGDVVDASAVVPVEAGPLPAGDIWLTVAQVASHYDVCTATVRRWIHIGRLRARALGGRAGYRISAAEVSRFISEETG
jgi:excisionase family DNA binding protein